MFVPNSVETAGQGAPALQGGAKGPSGLAEWWPILEKLGLPYNELRSVEGRASLAGVPFQAELMASGLVSEAKLFRALARHLGLGFVARVRPESLLMRQRHCLSALRRVGGVRTAAVMDAAGRPILLVAPDGLDIAAMLHYLARYPRIAQAMRIVPPSALRQAVMGRAKESLTRIAVHGLFETLPNFSARFVVNAWQGAALGALAVALAASLLLWPRQLLLVLHVVLSLSFLSCVALRLAVASSMRYAPPQTVLKAVRTEEMPVYTVLVALYKEAEIVPDLLLALGRLVWPRSKLEIKLVCESDDRETLEALRAQELRSYIEVVEVPPEGPRTKPKALSYALPMTTGELLVLYDAEDRPHPFQLVEAWQRFRESGEELACLQAPLVISNRRESWISAMFAFEYSALFHGMLPWLARHGLVLPLGGTSNHFRRAILERVGGWDPCNVTEDADLGLRLRRLGYETDTITFPTYEDAPTGFRVWLPQRTRWLKGWAQTWLVHMRDVREMARDLGPHSFAVTQVLFPGMLLSALGNSVFLLTILGLSAYFAVHGEIPSHYGAILLLDLFNVVFGYGAFLALGWWTLPASERHDLWKHVLRTPAYWTLLSLAAWRALWQLYRRPHHWEKTPHRPRRPAGASGQRRKAGPAPTTFLSSSPIASTLRPG
ncbi:glycosyltransferase [Chelativorans xinjiangense]|uniref:glycosyltransferase n=1 Tax=Chelativorans xinjiangense TaxID=2681485 RepID=UPI00135CC7FF|nr:glycosyltransferase [Chelativorans xinjiangense]